VPRFCYAGTYERDYPRNRLTARALRESGIRVEEAHVPVWERIRDKSSAGPRQMARTALALFVAYGRLIPEVALRLLRCDGLVVGYIGQVDMLMLGPVAKLMGKPVIFDPLVTMTDTVVEDRRLVSTRSPLAWAIAAIDRASLALADVVLADTPENARYMTDRFGVAASRIVVVPVGADEDVFYPASDPDWRDATDSKPLDVLFYGKFIPLHGIETILHAARLLHDRGTPARFEIVGTGQTYREMRDLAARLELTNVTWTDWIPEAQLGDRLRMADVALGVFSDNAKAGRVVPNKVYQSLASGVATVTRGPLPNPSPEKGGAFGADEVSGFVPPGNSVALADAIERLCSGDLRKKIARAGLVRYRQSAEATVRARLVGDAVERVMGDRWQRPPVHG